MGVELISGPIVARGPPVCNPCFQIRDVMIQDGKVRTCPCGPTVDRTHDSQSIALLLCRVPPPLSHATCYFVPQLLAPALAEDAISLSAFILWEKRPAVRESQGYRRQDCFSFRGSRRQGVAHRTGVLCRCSQPHPAGPHVLGPGQVAFNKTMEYEYVATSSLCSGIFLPGSSGFF